MHDAAKMTLRLKSPVRDEDHKRKLQYGVESYLVTLQKSGHIWGEYVLSWTSAHCAVYAYLAHPTALLSKYILPSVQQEIETLSTLFGQEPDWEILDESIDDTIPNIQQEDFLYMSTDAFDDSSPVRMGSTGTRLPVFFLPLTELERERVYFWMSAYRAHDRIWLYSGSLESPAYKELASPDSALSQEGRELCRTIESYTDIPTYYYLDRFWGRRQGEEQRCCPGCGNPWARAPGSPLSHHEFSNFAFQCCTCRLVSHIGPSTEDERHARIGEYRKKTVS